MVPVGRYGDVLPSYCRLIDVVLVSRSSGPTENPRTPRVSGRPTVLTRSIVMLARRSPWIAANPVSFLSRLRPPPTKLPSLKSDVPDKFAATRTATRVPRDAAG